MILPQLGRDSLSQLALWFPLLDLIAGRSHNFSEHPQSLSGSFFLSVNISNLIWHRNSNFSFSLNKPFPLLPGGLRRKIPEAETPEASSWDK